MVEQRYQKILNLMKEDGSVRVSELKKKLDVSSETIRRDLEHMEQQGMIRRVRGGAFLNASPEKQDTVHSLYQPFLQRGREHTDKKAEIASFAAGFVTDGQAIALDSGTTAYEVAGALKGRFKNLTVVTNSLAIANKLADASGITLVLTGGVYQPEEAAFTSDMAGMIFSRLSINTFFLTTCGISVDKGVTYQRMDEILVQEKMMEASDRTIVIADSSKLGVNSLVKMCDIDRISMIITDSSAKKEQMEAFIKAGVEIRQPPQR